MQNDPDSPSLAWEPASPSLTWDSSTAKRTLRDLPANTEREGVIYKIQFPNRKAYVGQTVQPLAQRIRQHFKDRTGCRALKAALRKYGTRACAVTVLCTLPRSKLDAAERRMIAKHHTMAPGGYNILAGGDQFVDEETQKVLRKQRMDSKIFQAARKEVQRRPATTHKRRQTTAAKRVARMKDLDPVEAGRMHYNAWRHAYRHARLAVERLPKNSLRDPFAEVAALYGPGPPMRTPEYKAALEAKEKQRHEARRRGANKQRI